MTLCLDKHSTACIVFREEADKLERRQSARALLLYCVLALTKMKLKLHFVFFLVASALANQVSGLQCSKGSAAGWGTSYQPMWSLQMPPYTFVDHVTGRPPGLVTVENHLMYVKVRGDEHVAQEQVCRMGRGNRDAGCSSPQRKCITSCQVLTPEHSQCWLSGRPQARLTGGAPACECPDTPRLRSSNCTTPQNCLNFKWKPCQPEWHATANLPTCQRT